MKASTKHRHQLLYQTLRWVREEPRLVIFPALCALFGFGMLWIVGYMVVWFEHITIANNKITLNHVAILYGIVLLTMFIFNQIVYFFDAGITYCSERVIHGKAIDLRGGLRACYKYAWRFFLWNLVASTFGVITIIFYGYFKKFAWYHRLTSGNNFVVASYFVVPLMVLQNEHYPIHGLRTSAAMVAQTWGSNLRTNFGNIRFFVYARLLALIPVIVGAIIGGKFAVLVGVAISVIFFSLFSLINHTIKSTLHAVLLYYVKQDEIPERYTEAMLKDAFVKRTP